jgi:Ca2+:H+ antiporter
LAVVARRLLWASLGLAPITIVVRFVFDPGDVTLFALAALSLIPLAWLIGEATEHAAKQTGPGIGGFLNATFGNAPELIIALFAVNDGLNEVVRGSLTGSVVGNLLLVLGVSLIVAPAKEFDRRSALTSIGLVLGATALFSIVAATDWDSDVSEHTLQVMSIPVAIALLIVYLGVTAWQLRRHHLLHAGADIDESAWSLRWTLVILGLATAATAFIAEILVGSIEVFAESLHLSDFFVAAVIVAIVGNAAEHGGAVIVARRGRVQLATEIAVSSSAQVAVFLIPAVAVISWAIEPLSLGFRQVEIGVLAGAAVLAGLILSGGRSSRWRGWVLLAGYVGAALIFYKAGGR